ncbi:alkaline phosphatase family protein [Oceanicoccus sagamiensis]|uniref:Alkaline phosphatase n=1 Tax=Oceanicoccus sagamiensis TaxID=716816 RepID=A0A1X9NPD7_9GAMM|nr:alkaline phosphatase family protein [Oceanicoccus sagamiensis]ARN75753.1 alkaline phosphatase [Oceanicoccus sagamiensis]
MLKSTGWLCLPLIMLFALNSFASNKPPKLILQITVDQLRADLPGRFLNKETDGGFKYLYEEGVVYHNAHHNHANTETIVGHTTLATGAVPAIHGMIGNVWFDRDDNRLIYNIEDPNYPLLSKDADVNKQTEIDPTQKAANTSGRSPQKIRVSTFSDELSMQSAGKAKIFGVSVKDRGAVAMAGHAGKAFWFSKKTGEFVTSRFYYEAYPQWVIDWNRQNYPQNYADKAWELLQESSNYLMGDKDDQEWEVAFPGFGRVFPHQYGKGDSKYFTTFLTLSPAGDELTADFAKTLILSENIGEDDITDYLSVSFSSTDYVGHLFGSSSLEMEDNLQRLDNTLASLFKFIDRQIGLKNTLIVLSADHGGADAAPYAQQQGIKAHYINPKEWNTKQAFSELNQQFGVDEALVKIYYHPYVYLDHEVIKKNQLDIHEVESAIAAQMSQFPGVALAIPSAQIAKGNLPNNDLYNAVVNNHNPQRSGDIFVVFEPYSFINDMDGLVVAAHHGSPWKYDTHVPVIFAGNKLKAQQVARKIHTVDIAPTLSAFIGAKIPSGSDGDILKEVVKK